MKILITGSTGLLGQALLAALSPRAEVVGTSRHAPLGSPAAHYVCDAEQPAAVAQLLARLQPNVVINAQALSNVDRCEQEPAAAEAGNVQTVRALVAALGPRRPLLVHVSTDYVFDGAQRRPYVETDRPNPLSVYGRSKLAGEQVALEYPRSVVVRTSTLFGPGRENFCSYIVRCVRAGQVVEAFEDQITSPTYTVDLAAGLADLTLRLSASAQTAPARLYHMTNEGQASRVVFARRVASLLGDGPSLVRPIRMAQQRRPAPRPPFSALASLTLPNLLGRRLRSWDEALQHYLQADPSGN